MTFNRESFSVLGLGVLITAGVFFYVGWYHWEFKRPPTAVYHNQYVSGDNATVTQNEPKEQKLNAIWLGVNPRNVKDCLIGYSRSF